MFSNTPGNFKMLFFLLCLAESWSQPGKPSWHWSFSRIDEMMYNVAGCWAYLYKQSSYLAVVCYYKPFPVIRLVKRSEMVHGTIAVVEWKTGEVSVGSGRVNAILPRLDPSLTLFSFRPDYRAVYWALRFTSWTSQTSNVITR